MLLRRAGKTKRRWTRCEPREQQLVDLAIGVALQVHGVAVGVGAVGGPPPVALAARRAPTRLLERKELVRDAVEVHELPVGLVE